MIVMVTLMNKIILGQVMTRKVLNIFLLFICSRLLADHQPEFSTAGFFQLDDTGREVFSMNVAWRFHKGESAGASNLDFNDKDWPVISIPHGIEYLPTEASGSVNYQGEVWYRKHFTPDIKLKGKKIFLHFEAIMGKSRIWVNGELLKENFGGFLPIVVDVGDYLNWGSENVIAVWADNGDDPLYPPGKAQSALDFAYFGGIYRDCWMVTHNKVYITNPNFEDAVAGGGLLIAYPQVSNQKSEIMLRIHLRNEGIKNYEGSIHYELLSESGQSVLSVNQDIKLQKQNTGTFEKHVLVENPQLWSPESPNLYKLKVIIKDVKGRVVDGYSRRIGIRSFEFKGKDGFWLNGKPYKKPLIGANRHQDFALVGNAVPNNTHWRDAKKLRDVGLKVIRNAHYPQDPAFMDACDELGLLVIVNTPGWQFWNEAPIFEKRVYNDIRNMVRRDRNHPSVWLWEPILNETWYPDHFAKNARKIIDEEFPYPNSYAACDAEAKGNEYFQILFGHPSIGEDRWALKHLDPQKTYFTREWGDNVDDWNSHNSPSRVNIEWGETPMLIQAQHYAKPNYKYTSYDGLFRTTPQHIGGSFWHSFDHQRGYHPDPFYGGIMDVFRQPKYAYYMFMSQRNPQKSNVLAETGPMIFIAHEMTPFSGKDVVVYSNCDEVKLTVFKNGNEYIYKKKGSPIGMPSPIIVFKNVYDFMADKEKSRAGKQTEVFMRADGFINGEIVVSHKVSPARRAEKLIMWIDNENVDLSANGSDLIVIIAAIADKNGNIKRLNNSSIEFETEGEGNIIGGEMFLSNPSPIRWGTAPVLIQSTTKAGKIKVKASVVLEGINTPTSTELVFESIPAKIDMVFSDTESKASSVISIKQAVSPSVSDGKLRQEIEKRTQRYKIERS